MERGKNRLTVRHSENSSGASSCRIVAAFCDACFFLIPSPAPGDSTHLMSISSQPGLPAPPDEDTIRHQVRTLFERLDTGK